MMSGSVVSNVLTAGTMTIPTMKRTGFTASYAGAIEACASTGAVLAPPVMGATAFVIAQFLNISYAEVALAAIIPAALYYLALFMQVDSYAARHGLKGLPRAELPSAWATIKEGWYYVLRRGAADRHAPALQAREPRTLLRDRSAPAAEPAFFQGEPLDRCKTIISFLEVNGRTFVELVGILAGCGLLIGAFSMTGVVSSLANDLLRIAGDNAFLLLVMCAITSLVLGLGLTTTACYIFLAILVAPALEKLGLNKMAVHMFIFYWGMLSAITPPVAIASFAAAGIAGAPAMKTGWESMWVGSIIYFIPFFFVLNPALVLQGPSPYLAALGLTLLAGIGTLFICGGIQGYQAGVGDLRGAGNVRMAACACCWWWAGSCWRPPAEASCRCRRCRWSVSASRSWCRRSSSRCCWCGAARWPSLGERLGDHRGRAPSESRAANRGVYIKRRAMRRASGGPAMRTSSSRAVCNAITKDMSALLEAAMIAIESTPPGHVAR